MDEHEKLKQKLIQEGIDDPKTERDFLDIANGFDKILVVPLENMHGFQAFLNGEYIFDVFLSMVATKPENFIQMFVSHIERQRDRAYPPLKGYFKIFQGDASRKELPKPHNPLGLCEENQELFVKMITAGFIRLSKSISGKSAKTMERATNLLDWLGIEIPE